MAKFNEEQLNYEPVSLNAAQRRSVEKAVRDTCIKRRWDMIALNVRTNHAHAVIDIGTKNAQQSLNAIKTNATLSFTKTGFGVSLTRLGLKKAARGSSGMSEALSKLVIMF